MRITIERLEPRCCLAPLGFVPRGDIELVLDGSQAVDLDGDGDIDEVTISEGQIVWIENTGAPEVTAHEHLITGDLGAREVLAGDVDGDGQLDVWAVVSDGIKWYEPFVPLPGDANLDGQFDQRDIVQILQANKLSTGRGDGGPAVWEEGDWTGDGVFDRFDIIAANLAGLYLQGPYVYI